MISCHPTLAAHLPGGRHDAQGQTPLYKAAHRGIWGVVTLLLERGAAVGQADHEGHTALMVAAENSHSEVEALLRHISMPWTVGAAGRLQAMPRYVKLRALTAILCLRRCSGLPRELIDLVISHCRVS